MKFKDIPADEELVAKFNVYVTKDKDGKAYVWCDAEVDDWENKTAIFETAQMHFLKMFEGQHSADRTAIMDLVWKKGKRKK